VRWSDIDLKRAIFQIVRTIHRETTKNGEQRKGRPIHSELMPFLLEQRKLTGEGDLVFPATPARGSWEADLARADIVTSYRHVCRRRRCGHSFIQEARAEGSCEKCGFRLSIYGVPKDLPAYNLRHTGVTLYQEAETREIAVAAMAGHKKKEQSITDRVYTAKRTAMLRKEIEKLQLFAPPEEPATAKEDKQGILPFPTAPQVPPESEAV
jgi:integrase